MDENVKTVLLAENAARVLRAMGWLALAVGLVANFWTFFQNFDDFGPGQATLFMASVLGPTVVAWGVCVGLGVVIEVLTTLVPTDSETPPTT